MQLLVGAVIGLLVLPHYATAASIPLVFDFIDGTTMRGVLTIEGPVDANGAVPFEQIHFDIDFPTVVTPPSVGALKTPLGTGRAYVDHLYWFRGATYANTTPFSGDWEYLEGVILQPQAPLPAVVTVEAMIERLMWGGNASLFAGWDDGQCEFVAPECVPGISRNFQGSYAVDTAAVVPEPTSLLLLGSGLALARRRRLRST